MTGRDFLDVAFDLLAGSREADWRSATSRAYYAGFHCARELLLSWGFSVPISEQAHAYLWRRLSNCGHPDIREAGLRMYQLRGTRNWADYDLHHPLRQSEATVVVESVEAILDLLDEMSSLPHIQMEIIEAIKKYERDVLREQSWKS
jgi:uncharacterized protein (UPF0332 family)